MSRDWELPITESELHKLTGELDEAHRESMPGMLASADDLTEEIRSLDAAGDAGEPSGTARGLSRGLDRRRLLFGLGGVGAAMALAACTSDKTVKAAGAPSGSPSGSPSSMYTGDFKVVALAAALENQAVGAYKAALDAAAAGKLGKVPPAVATFAKTAMSQHADHAKAWNAVLTGAGKKAISGVPLSGHQAVVDALGKVKDVTGVAKLALQLEDQATETYMFAAANVKSEGGIKTAATIAPVEAMHAAILHFVLGQYPVPADFFTTDKAVSPDQLTV
ncbi:ferritin-like domain-containing protein [Streptomyces sp. H27-C3]|uniref:ferritin-like domain-containing protein n=1 Tax=Streptomyces sp. H27-C3 TaxID=3046305 RepID=UPI0024BA3FD0|nr:ferritin-like domain-containing protein [Streptomyces sp. H27-C3]MDJ0463837.1 ferritin-like domain-containing protein [Streptomyces sp. H27-C3]